MTWKVGACVTLFLVCFGLLIATITAADKESRRVKGKARTERCISMCVNRGSMSHWTTIKVGFGSFQVICVCWDATETRLP